MNDECEHFYMDTLHNGGMDLLDRLLGHDAWTTGMLLSQSRRLSDMQLDQHFDISRFTVRTTLDHIIENMELWTDLMKGQPLVQRPAPSSQWRTLDALEARLNSVAPQLASFARSIQQGGRLDDTWTDTLDSPPTRKSFGGTIAHVLWHSAHHRSQLILMLRALGVQGVIEGDMLSWEARHAAVLAES
jgi:uncharacterized damage-inducible protein DinB